LALASIAHWAQANHLTFNIAKSQEMLFSDKRQKEKFSAEIAQLKRVQTIKILGVTVTKRPFNKYVTLFWIKFDPIRPLCHKLSHIG